MEGTTHPLEEGRTVRLNVLPEFIIYADVMGYALSTDGAYHYDLQSIFSDQTGNSATVQIKDVHQSLIIL